MTRWRAHLIVIGGILSGIAQVDPEVLREAERTLAAPARGKTMTQKKERAIHGALALLWGLFVVWCLFLAMGFLKDESLDVRALSLMLTMTWFGAQGLASVLWIASCFMRRHKGHWANADGTVTPQAPMPVARHFPGDPFPQDYPDGWWPIATHHLGYLSDGPVVIEVQWTHTNGVNHRTLVRFRPNEPYGNTRQVFVDVLQGALPVETVGGKR
jgi:hypothetical protein